MPAAAFATNEAFVNQYKMQPTDSLEKLCELLKVYDRIHYRDPEQGRGHTLSVVTPLSHHPTPYSN